VPSLEDRKNNFLVKFIKKFGDTWEILSEYKSARQEMLFKCKKCFTIVKQTPKSFLFKSNCKNCYSRVGTGILSNDDFIKKSIAVHGNQFDYSKSKYTGNNNKIIIFCIKHSCEFLQEPRNHWIGHGCSNCTLEKLHLINLKSKDDFVNASTIIHGNKYGYEKVNYYNNNTDVEIYCFTCGVYFFQKPRLHTSGHGCIPCSILSRVEKITKTSENFILQANFIHKNIYKYDVSNFTGFSKNKINIFCFKCNNWFEQRPCSHLQGSGCPQCCGGSISKAERRWFDILNVPKKYRQKTIKFNNGKDKFKVDAYDPITNTVYEFDGDWWHGNPDIFDKNDINVLNKKSFGDLYTKTLNKRAKLIELGYNLVYIWENDFYKQFGKK
jgi:hypothetical protein